MSTLRCVKQASHKRQNAVGFHLDEAPRVVRLRNSEQDDGCPRGRGGGEGEKPELLFKGCGDAVLQEERVMESGRTIV